MIARLWSARTTRHNADTYQELFPIDALAATAGFGGAFLLRRDHETGVEFVTVTLFESMDAVRAFAGDDPETATVSDAARAVLDDADDRVRHFTVVIGPAG